ncbi:MAG: glycosyltransferase family 2 protein [Lachnospiraceae bacterium]|nr:glycosyltransferase family 2 protein [Lachnospiraceae bacterium]
MRVNAVVVTYNRLDLLKRSIGALLEQTFCLNRIIIVNNASTDGTRDYLKNISKDNRIIVLNLKKNLGGAGGFYHGIKRAYEEDCDYVWIMDDDTIAKDDALEKLIDAADVLKEKQVGFLASNVLWKDDSPCVMNVSRTVSVWNEYIKQGIIEVSHTSFVAMLIPAKVVKDVGLPIKEYYIWGDDGEYSTRILRSGYHGYSVGGSTVHHHMKENIGVDIMTTPKDRIDRFFYFYRNNTVTDKMRGPFLLCRRLLYHGYLMTKILFGRTDHKMTKIKTVVKATISGLFMRVRIRYIM